MLHRLTFLTLLVPTLALAYPSQVRDILKGASQSAVVRAPGTIDEATKKDLEDAARATAHKSGGKVFFIVDNKTSPSDYDSLYTDLGLTGHDMVIASNGPGWSLQCGSLSAQQKQDILNREGMAGGKPADRMKKIADDAANALALTKSNAMTWNEFEHANAGKGLTTAQMREAYAHYKQTGGMPVGVQSSTGTQSSTTLAPSPQTQQSSGHGGLIFLGVVVALIVGVVFWRRRKRDETLAADWKTALEAPTRVMTDIYGGLDGMEKHPNFVQMMDQLTVVQNKIDALKSAPPSRENIARLQGLTEEANRVRLNFDQARRSLA